MDTEHVSRNLILSGIILFLLGLLTGIAVPHFLNPRMGISAHLEGVLTGMFLVILGLIWGKTSLSVGLSKTAFLLALYGGYANWASAFLAAVFGTSGMTPMAGAGFRGEPWQEITVLVIQVSLSAALVTACGIVAWGLYKAGRSS